MICPAQLIPAFTMFIATDGYKCVINKIVGEAVFTKANKPGLKIDRFGNMNEPAQKRYELFLKLWLKNGKAFVLRLQAQAIMLKVA
ncbi:hypothetical protein CDG60_09850 [Acinetobacter chinensis]|uniref:Uncharacterized protein n=1 Tax=Acinetobacter chinensis TaxID=2004650 RepID=A0A3B7LWG6_9GAMM|nr:MULTISPECIES: hypothetical protein [Acinetobacter]AXY56838.1 hypothetical protein CDG60_09850 [Acinetobacter chinensis]AXY60225.1 hypothetical protein CDG61_09425 [Acinetobacter sp. WCHAc010052]